MKRNDFAAWLAAGCLCLVLTGCGGPYEATVSGIVTLDGEPLPSGAVTFHAVAGGPAVIGTIGADGSYTLRTGASDGLPPGDYIVTAKALSGDPVPGMTPEQFDDLSLTPVHYGNKETTDLRVTVASGHNDLDLQLMTPDA
jgi:hypothetical protein